MTSPADGVPSDSAVTPSTDTTSEVAVTPEPVAAPPSAQLVAMTNEQLQSLISSAVAAAVAQAQATMHMSEGARLAAGPVPVELPTLWNLNQLMHHIVSNIRWYNERLERSAKHSTDYHFPVPSDDEAAGTDVATVSR